MRIAIFIKATTFHKNHGGLEVQNRILAEGLAQSNEVVVYSPKGNLDFASRIEMGVFYKFIEAKWKNENILQSIKNIGVKNEWDKKSAEMFVKDHSEKPFDVVISQSSAGLGIIKNKNKLKVKVLSVAHGTILGEFRTLLSRPKTPKRVILIAKDFEYTVRNYFTRQRGFLRGSDSIVAVSKFVAKNVAKESGLSLDRIKVIHNGVSNFGETLSLRSGSPVNILFVGRIEEDKGVFELVKLFAGLLKKHGGNLKLLFAGEGTDESRLKDMVQSLSLEDSVRFLGFLQKDELEKYYLASHIFVLPTKRIEGFPVTIPEAMIAGLPIVAFDLGGVGEGVVNDQTGFLLPKNRWDLFEDKLSQLISDESLRERFSSEARIYARENFLRDKMIDSYEEVLKGLI